MQKCAQKSLFFNLNLFFYLGVSFGKKNLKKMEYWQSEMRSIIISEKEQLIYEMIAIWGKNCLRVQDVTFQDIHHDMREENFLSDI